jgi:hypothetical protein
MRLARPSTRAEIQKLISTNDRFNSFSDACIWPDHPRQRASEHFVNLPRDSNGLGSESCPSASACVVTAIKKDFEVLSSNSAGHAQKLASLKFLGHWLACSYRNGHEEAVAFLLLDDQLRVLLECRPDGHGTFTDVFYPSGSIRDEGRVRGL